MLKLYCQQYTTEAVCNTLNMTKSKPHLIFLLHISRKIPGITVCKFRKYKPELTSCSSLPDVSGLGTAGPLAHDLKYILILSP